MRRIRVLIFLLSVFGAITSCSKNSQPLIPNPAPTQHTTITPWPTSDLPHWTKKWLDKKSCGVSCWEGIVPGTTSASEAFKLLNSNEMVRELRKSAVDSTYMWLWKDETPTLYLGTEIETEAQVHFDEKGIVSDIYIPLPLAVHTLKLGDVINAYGEPSHIWTWSRCEPTRGYHSSIIYENYGFYLIPYETDEKPNIDADLYIDVVIFSKVDNSWYSEHGSLDKWQGYNGNYDFPFDKSTDNFANQCMEINP